MKLQKYPLLVRDSNMKRSKNIKRRQIHAIYILAFAAGILGALFIGIGLGENDWARGYDTSRPYQVNIFDDGHAIIWVRSQSYINQFGESLVIRAK